MQPDGQSWKMDPVKPYRTQEHTIFSNTVMLWGGFLFLYIFFTVCIFFNRKIRYFRYLQKYDTPKFEFVAETGGC